MKEAQVAVLLTVGRSYVGNDVTHSTLLNRACACSYENLPKYRSYTALVTRPPGGLTNVRVNGNYSRGNLVTLHPTCTVIN